MASRELQWRDVHAARQVRHLLVEGAVSIGAHVVAERVCGLQAQVDGGPVLSVLARNPIAKAAWLRASMSNARLARTWALRGTLHLVAAKDLHRFGSALGDSVAAREVRLWPRHGVPANAEDRVYQAMRDALADGPLDRRTLASRVGEALGDEYRRLLEHPWGIGLKPAVARGLIRLSGSGRTLRLSLADPPKDTLDPAEAQRWLARAYLAVNVVGTAASFAAWTGLPVRVARAALHAVAERTVRVEGVEYLAAGEIEAAPGVVRLLPAFDPFVLAVADKIGFCPPGTAPLIYRRAGWISPVIVLDGLPLGTWRTTNQRRPRVVCEPFAPLRPAIARAVAQQAERVEAFLAATK